MQQDSEPSWPAGLLTLQLHWHFPSLVLEVWSLTQLPGLPLWQMLAVAERLLAWKTSQTCQVGDQEMYLNEICFILVSSFDGLVIVARVVCFLMVCISVFSNHCLSVQSLLQDRPICLASKTLGFPSWTGGFTVLALPLQPQTLCFNKQAVTFLPVGLWQHFMHNLHTVILYFDWH